MFLVILQSNSSKQRRYKNIPYYSLAFMPALEYCLIAMRGAAPRKAKSRGTPSRFVYYVKTNICAKFGAFTRFVTIFNLTDWTSKRAQ